MRTLTPPNLCRPASTDHHHRLSSQFVPAMPTDAAGNAYRNRSPNAWFPKRFAGLRYYDTPLFRPLWPFLVGALITYYGVWKLQGVMMNSEQYYNDPRHPRFKHGYTAEMPKVSGEAHH